MSRRAASALRIGLVSGHRINVPDRYNAQVGDFVSTEYEGTSDGQARLVQRSLLKEHEISASSAGSTFPASGLLPAMQWAAQQQQVPITVMMPDSQDLPTPVRSPLTKNPVIAEFIHRYDAGIIEYGGSLSKAQIVGEVCLAFPGHRVLVASSHRHELRRIFTEVPKYAPFVGVVDVSRGELPFDIFDAEVADESPEIKSCQLALSTPLTAAMLWETTGTGVREYPIVIFLDVARAKDLMTSGFLMASYAKFRLFGLRHIESPRPSEAIDLAYNVFGPVCLRVPESEFEQSEISHVWVPNSNKLRNMPRSPKLTDALRLIPHCTERNNLVADVARQLVGGCRLQDDDLVDHWRTNHDEPPTVAIIARTFTHAARLIRRLPDWHVFRPDTAPELLIGLNSADRAIISDRSVPWTDNNRVICLLDNLQRFLARHDPEIIIQASGGLQAPKFPTIWFMHPTGTQRRRLVIDFFDGALPLTTQISNRRFASYRHPDFLPIDLEASREHLSIGLPLLEFISRTFKPAKKRRRRQ